MPEEKKKVKVLKFYPEGLAGPLVLRFDDEAFAYLKTELEEGEPGDEYIVFMDEMTEDELLNLPEHQGW